MNKRHKAMRISFIALGLAFLSAAAAFGSFTIDEFTNLAWQKYEGNPIMYPKGTTFEAYSIFNCAITEKDGTFYMFYRAENWDGRGGQIVGNGVDKGGASRICLATSTNLISGWERWTNNPIIDNDQGYEQIDPPYGYNGGCEDPRIFKKDDTWYITYTGFHGAVDTCLAASQDLMNWTKKGPIINNRKNGVILPSKINGRYYMYYGDSAFWVAWTDRDDLTGWHDVNGEVTLFTPGYADFDSWSMETSAPLMLCEDGILFLYFGVRGITSAERNVCTPHLPAGGGDGVASDATGIYSLGWALTSMNNPYSVLRRAKRPFLVCAEPYELVGQIYGALFGESILRRVEKAAGNKFREKWYFHYGGGDTYMCVATALSPTNKAVLKYHLPAMAKGSASFESSAVYNPSALFESGSLKMIYTAFDGLKTRLGKAESGDGFTFVRHPSPVLEPSTNFYDRFGMDSPSLFTKQGRYYMTYNGVDNGATAGNICLASSTNLILWTRHGEIFQPQKAWCRNNPVQNGVIVPMKINDRWVMYFEGKSAPGESRIGMAYCDSDDISNPANWYEPLEQPVALPRSGYFDSQGLRPAGRPVVSSNKILLFYNGWGSDARVMTGWVSFSRSDPGQVADRCAKHIIMPTDEFEGVSEMGSGSLVQMNGAGYFHYGAGKKNIGLALFNDIGATLGIQITTNTNPSVLPPVSGKSPRFAAGLSLARSAGANTITWSPVSANEDGSAFSATNEQIQYYKVYRSFSADEGWSLLGQTAALSWQDTPLPGGTCYYKVTAVNRSGNEGGAWAVLDSSDEQNTVALLEEGGRLRTKIVIPGSAAAGLLKSGNGSGDDLYLTVSQNPVPESPSVFSGYDIKARYYATGEVTGIFKPGEELLYSFYYYISDAGYVENSRVVGSDAGRFLRIFLHNGVEWVIRGGTIDTSGQSLTLKENGLAWFGLGAGAAYVKFTLLQLEPSKVFSPAAAYPNNEIRFYFANPEMETVSCAILDMKGRAVKTLTPHMATQTEGRFSWDGRDEENRVCRSGPYIYQIIHGGKTINGVVVLAK